MKKKYFSKLTFLILLTFLSLSCFANQLKENKTTTPDIQTNNLPESSKEWKNKIVIIPVTGVIAPESYGGQEENIINAIKLASEANKIILEIDSPGGVVNSCDQICNTLINSKVPTTAIIKHKAVSGGAMVATACEKIYMLSGSRIGDIQPMTMMPSKGLDERTAEKAEADVRAIMAANASHNGYPKVLLEAMVTRSFEIYEVNFKDGTQKFLKKSAYELLRKNMTDGIDKREFSKPPKIVVTAGKLLSVEAQSAVEYKIATKILSSIDEYYTITAINMNDVVRVELAEGELDPLKLVDFSKWELGKGLTMLLVFCLIIGVAGTFTEMSMPGFGIPGALGLIGFASFFTILFLHERATIIEISLFVLGIILLIIEIIVIPGFGIAGILGLICLFGGLLFSLLPELNSNYMETNFGSEIMFALLITFGVIFIGGILILIIMERGEKSRFLKFLFLDKKLPDGKTALKKARKIDAIAEKELQNKYENYLGKTGFATTTLRPAGKVKLDNSEIIDVVTSGNYIAKNSRIIVDSVDMNRIVVKLIDE